MAPRSLSSAASGRVDSTAAPEGGPAVPELPSNVVLDEVAQALVAAAAEAPVPHDTADADARVDAFLERLGDVATRPLREPALQLATNDLMAGDFEPLARPHRLATEAAAGVAGDDPEVINLDPDVWAEPLRVDLLHRAVEWQRAKRRTTLYKGRTYAEKSGSGRKPFRQKGTGMARQGNKRAPIHRGGVKAHAPVLRDWSKGLPRAVRRKALRVALSAKLSAGRVGAVTGAAAFESAKTADLLRRIRAVADAAGMARDDGRLRLLVVVGEAELTPQLRVASSALQEADVVTDDGCTVLDLLRSDGLLVTPAAVAALEARLTR